MPRTASPTGRASRLLGLLASTPGQPWEITALAAELDLPTDLVGQTLTSATRNAALTSPWRNVRRITRGLWVYDPVPARRPANPWQPVAHQTDDKVVLRGPDGRLWLARPL